MRIKCPNCGLSFIISEHSPKCPKCGRVFLKFLKIFSEDKIKEKSHIRRTSIDVDKLDG